MPGCAPAPARPRRRLEGVADDDSENAKRRCRAEGPTACDGGDISAFLATATGAHYADKQFSMFMDPEMMKEMTAFMPEMLKRLPELMEQAKKATAALPPARKLKDLSPQERKRLAELLGVPDDKLADPRNGFE